MQRRKGIMHWILAMGWLSLSLLPGLASATSTKNKTPSPAASAKPLTPKSALALAERILRLSNQKKYKQILPLMNAVIQKTISVEQLGQQLSMTLNTIGPYKPNTLVLRSQVTQSGHTRFIWQGTFKKEKGTVLALFDATNQIAGFIIQSPTLLRKIRQESPTTLSPALVKQLSVLLDGLLKGYNSSNWKAFCQNCNAVMKVLLKPPRFSSLRKVYSGKFGDYISKRFTKASRLSLAKILILHYKADFTKAKGITIQIAFKKTNGKHEITGWQLKP